jgi:hypothetical protein
MTSASGTLTPYFNLCNNNRGIIVGNDHSIPIRGYGNTSLSPPNPPLALRNVLHAPQIIKNLIYVRKLTTDNSMSVEFDPFDFSVKDFQTGKCIMRCESRGELYPITGSHRSTTPEFAALVSTTLHERLGHPGAQVIKFVRHMFVLLVQLGKILNYLLLIQTLSP